MSNKADTERLDWALLHPAANYDHDGKTGEHWITFRLNGEQFFVSGRNHRECIDNAIEGNYTRID